MLGFRAFNRNCFEEIFISTTKDCLYAVEPIGGLFTMPQELHVVKCYACHKFQVQIVKKVPKWQCKVCNEKQSILKVYAQGSGKDCRQYVQELNMKQGLLMSSNPLPESSSEHENDPPVIPALDYLSNGTNVSKWSNYLEDTGFSDNCGHSGSDDQYDKNEASEPSFTSSHRKRKLDHLLNNEGFIHVSDHTQETSNVLEDSYDTSAAQLSKSFGNKFSKSESRFSAQDRSAGVSTSKQSKWSHFIKPDEGTYFNPRSQNTLNVGDFDYNDIRERKDSMCANTGSMRRGNKHEIGSEKPSKLFVPLNRMITDNNPINSFESLKTEPQVKSCSSFTSAAHGGSSKWCKFVSQDEEGHPSPSQEEDFDPPIDRPERLTHESNPTLFDPSYSLSQSNKVQKVFSHNKAPLTVKHSFKTTTNNLSPIQVRNSICQANSEVSSEFKNPFCNTDDENLDNILEF